MLFSFIGWEKSRSHSYTHRENGRDSNHANSGDENIKNNRRCSTDGDNDHSGVDHQSATGDLDEAANNKNGCYHNYCAEDRSEIDEANFDIQLMCLRVVREACSMPGVANEAARQGYFKCITEFVLWTYVTFETTASARALGKIRDSTLQLEKDTETHFQAQLKTETHPSRQRLDTRASNIQCTADRTHDTRLPLVSSSIYLSQLFEELFACVMQSVPTAKNKNRPVQPLPLPSYDDPDKIKNTDKIYGADAKSSSNLETRQLRALFSQQQLPYQVLDSLLSLFDKDVYNPEHEDSSLSPSASTATALSSPPVSSSPSSAHSSLPPGGVKVNEETRSSNGNSANQTVVSPDQPPSSSMHPGKHRSNGCTTFVGEKRMSEAFDHDKCILHHQSRLTALGKCTRFSSRHFHVAHPRCYDRDSCPAVGNSDACGYVFLPQLQQYTLRLLHRSLSSKPHLLHLLRSRKGGFYDLLFSKYFLFIDRVQDDLFEPFALASSASSSSLHAASVTPVSASPSSPSSLSFQTVPSKHASSVAGPVSPHGAPMAMSMSNSPNTSTSFSRTSLQRQRRNSALKGSSSYSNTTTLGGINDGKMLDASDLSMTCGDDDNAIYYPYLATLLKSQTLQFVRFVATLNAELNHTSKSNVAVANGARTAIATAMNSGKRSTGSDEEISIDAYGNVVECHALITTMLSNMDDHGLIVDLSRCLIDITRLKRRPTQLSLARCRGFTRLADLMEYHQEIFNNIPLHYLKSHAQLSRYASHLQHIVDSGAHRHGEINHGVHDSWQNESILSESPASPRRESGSRLRTQSQSPSSSPAPNSPVSVSSSHSCSTPPPFPTTDGSKIIRDAGNVSTATANAHQSHAVGQTGAGRGERYDGTHDGSKANDHRDKQNEEEAVVDAIDVFFSARLNVLRLLDCLLSTDECCVFLLSNPRLINASFSLISDQPLSLFRFYGICFTTRLMVAIGPSDDYLQSISNMGLERKNKNSKNRNKKQIPPQPPSIFTSSHKNAKDLQKSSDGVSGSNVRNGGGDANESKTKHTYNAVSGTDSDIKGYLEVSLSTQRDSDSGVGNEKAGAVLQALGLILNQKNVVMLQKRKRSLFTRFVSLLPATIMEHENNALDISSSSITHSSTDYSIELVLDILLAIRDVLRRHRSHHQNIFRRRRCFIQVINVLSHHVSNALAIAEDKANSTRVAEGSDSGISGSGPSMMVASRAASSSSANVVKRGHNHSAHQQISDETGDRTDIFDRISPALSPSMPASRIVDSSQELESEVASPAVSPTKYSHASAYTTSVPTFRSPPAMRMHEGGTPVLHPVDHSPVPSAATASPSGLPPIDTTVAVAGYHGTHLTRLCISVIRTLTCLIANNKRSRDHFRINVGYDLLIDLLARAQGVFANEKATGGRTIESREKGGSKMSQAVFAALFDMLVEGKFCVYRSSFMEMENSQAIHRDLSSISVTPDCDSVRGYSGCSSSAVSVDLLLDPRERALYCMDEFAVSDRAVGTSVVEERYIILNADVLDVIFSPQLLLDCSIDFQSLLLSIFTCIVFKSTLNQAYCSKVHLIDSMLDLFPHLPLLLIPRVVTLIKILGTHSITVKELKRFFGLMPSFIYNPKNTDDMRKSRESYIDLFSSSASSSPSPSMDNAGDVAASPSTLHRLRSLKNRSSGGSNQPQHRSTSDILLKDGTASTLEKEKIQVRPSYTPELLEAIEEMSKKEGPTNFFYFDGVHSGLYIPPLDGWPATRGYTFSTWLRIESYDFPVKKAFMNHASQASTSSTTTSSLTLTSSSQGHHQPRLFRFMTQEQKGLGIEAFFDNQKLTIQVTNKNNGETCSETLDKILKLRTWYHLVITQSVPSTFSNSEFRIYVDSQLEHSSSNLKYPSINQPLKSCFIGTDNLAPAPRAMYGQMGPLYIFDDALSALDIETIFLLGPSYMFTFGPDTLKAEFEKADLMGSQSKNSRYDTVTTPSKADKAKEKARAAHRSILMTNTANNYRNTLESKIFLAYNSKARDGAYFLDNTPRFSQFSSDRTKRKKRGMHALSLSGTHQCVTRHVKDVLHCLGGISVLFPLFHQLEHPTLFKSRLHTQSQAQTLTNNEHVCHSNTSAKVSLPRAAKPGHNSHDGHIMQQQQPTQSQQHNHLQPPHQLSDLLVKLEKKVQNRRENIRHSPLVRKRRKSVQTLLELDYSVDPRLLVNIFRVLRVMLSDSVTNQVFMRNCRGFSIIALKLSQASPKHLTLEALQTLEDLIQSVSYDQDLLKDAFFSILANFSLWVYTQEKVRKQWVKVLIRVGQDYPELMCAPYNEELDSEYTVGKGVGSSDDSGLREVLDCLRGVFWSRQERYSIATSRRLLHAQTYTLIGNRPDQQELLQIRQNVLLMLRVAILHRGTISLSQTESLVFYMQSVGDECQKADILRVLFWFLEHDREVMLGHLVHLCLRSQSRAEGKTKASSFGGVNHNQRKGIDIFLNLLEHDHQALRVLSLRVIDVLLRAGADVYSREICISVRHIFQDNPIDLDSGTYYALLSILLGRYIDDGNIQMVRKSLFAAVPSTSSSQSYASSPIKPEMQLDHTHCASNLDIFPIFFDLMCKMTDISLMQMVLEDMAILIHSHSPVFKLVYANAREGWQTWFLDLLIHISDLREEFLASSSSSSSSALSSLTVVRASVMNLFEHLLFDAMKKREGWKQFEKTVKWLSVYTHIDALAPLPPCGVRREKLPVLEVVFSLLIDMRAKLLKQVLDLYELSAENDFSVSDSILAVVVENMRHVLALTQDLILSRISVCTNNEITGADYDDVKAKSTNTSTRLNVFTQRGVTDTTTDSQTSQTKHLNTGKKTENIFIDTSSVRGSQHTRAHTLSSTRDIEAIATRHHEFAVVWPLVQVLHRLSTWVAKYQKVVQVELEREAEALALRRQRSYNIFQAITRSVSQSSQPILALTSGDTFYGESSAGVADSILSLIVRIIMCVSLEESSSATSLSLLSSQNVFHLNALLRDLVRLPAGPSSTCENAQSQCSCKVDYFATLHAHSHMYTQTQTQSGSTHLNTVAMDSLNAIDCIYQCAKEDATGDHINIETSSMLAHLYVLLQSMIGIVPHLHSALGDTDTDCNDNVIEKEYCEGDDNDNTDNRPQNMSTHLSSSFTYLFICILDILDAVQSMTAKLTPKTHKRLIYTTMSNTMTQVPESPQARMLSQEAVSRPQSSLPALEPVPDDLWAIPTPRCGMCETSTHTNTLTRSTSPVLFADSPMNSQASPAVRGQQQEENPFLKEWIHRCLETFTDQDSIWPHLRSILLSEQFTHVMRRSDDEDSGSDADVGDNGKKVKNSGNCENKKEKMGRRMDSSAFISSHELELRKRLSQFEISTLALRQTESTAVFHESHVYERAKGLMKLIQRYHQQGEVNRRVIASTSRNRDHRRRMRMWRNIVRELTNERGPWSIYLTSEERERVYWKLDTCETKNRMRKRFCVNYDGSDHREATYQNREQYTIQYNLEDKLKKEREAEEIKTKESKEGKGKMEEERDRDGQSKPSFPKSFPSVDNDNSNETDLLSTDNDIATTAKALAAIRLNVSDNVAEKDSKSVNEVTPGFKASTKTDHHQEFERDEIGGYTDEQSDEDDRDLLLQEEGTSIFRPNHKIYGRQHQYASGEQMDANLAQSGAQQLLDTYQCDKLSSSDYDSDSARRQAREGGALLDEKNKVGKHTKANKSAISKSKSTSNDFLNLWGGLTGGQQQKQEETPLLEVKCTRIKPPSAAIPGTLILTSTHLYFDAEGNDGDNTASASNKIRQKAKTAPTLNTRFHPYDLYDDNSSSVGDDQKWSITHLASLHYRRYQLRRCALEIFCVNHNNSYLAFKNEKVRNQVHDKIRQRMDAYQHSVIKRGELLNDTNNPGGRVGLDVEEMDPMQENDGTKMALTSFKKIQSFPYNYHYAGSGMGVNSEVLSKSNLTEMWRHRRISNFQYLMHLNTIAGRTYNDLAQYPVFPWVIADYTSDTLDLDNEATYRDLSKPIGALNEDLLPVLTDRYASLEETDIPPFHHGTHYSSEGSVLFYLIRVEPFTSQAIALQDGKFDVADRMFHSIPQTWKGLMNNCADVRELTPEFFYLPEMLRNENNLDLGNKQIGVKLDDVVLPPWAKTPEDFVRINRAVLESEYVSQNLHHWIDLIFGYKQKGEAAVKALNVFFHLTYEGSVDIDSIEDETTRKATVDQINNFGQTPSQLLTAPHPSRLAKDDTICSVFEKIDGLQLWAVQKVTAKASIDNPLLFIQHCTDRILTIGLDRILKMHKWKNSTPEYVPPFSFEMEKKNNKSKPRRVGVHFAVGLKILPFFFLTSQCQRYLLSCGHWDNSFRCSHIETGYLMHSVSQHKDIVTCMALSETGNILVTGSKDTTVMVWEVGAVTTQISTRAGGDEEYIGQTPIHILYGHDDEVTCVDVNQDLDIVASGSKDGSCIIHTLKTGAYLRTIYPPSSSPYLSMKVSMTEPQEMEMNSSTAHSEFTDQSYTSDANTPADDSRRATESASVSTSAADGYKLEGDDIDSSEEQKKGRRYGNPTEDINMSTSSVNTINNNLHNMSSKHHGNLNMRGGGPAAIAAANQGGCLRWVAISPQGYIVTYSLNDLNLHLYSLNGRHLYQVDTGERLYALRFSRDGEFLVTGGDRKLVVVRRSHDLEVVHTFKAGSTVRSITITDSEQHLLVGLQNGHILIYSLNASYLHQRFYKRLVALGF